MSLVGVPSEVLMFEGAAFEKALYEHLSNKRESSLALSSVEEEAWLLLVMLPRIEMEGFVDLFYQCYSLKDCAIVQTALRKLELNRLAQGFAEAFSIYSNGNAEITEQEYRLIDPFGNSEHWNRFDQIGEELLAPSSEIYLISERLELYVKGQSRE